MKSSCCLNINIFKMNKLLLNFLVVVLGTNLMLAQNSLDSNKSSPLIIGEKVVLYSNVLNEERTLNIYLPQSYATDSLKKYPIIYLLDGSLDEDFIHISGLVQFGSFSWINMLPESIVVGIANVDRKRDFTYPTKNSQDLNDFPTTGHSSEFIQFLGNELQPYIEKKYRNTSEKTIIGQSLGGLLATEILHTEPSLFNNYVIVSPSLWWDDESLLQLDLANVSKVNAIYIGVGKEGPIMERVAKELEVKLRASIGGDTKLYFNFFPNQAHGDALHLAVYDAFTKIFKNVEEDLEN